MTPTRRRGTLSKGTGSDGRGSRVEGRVAVGGVKLVKLGSGPGCAGKFGLSRWPNPIRNDFCSAKGFGTSGAGVNAGGKCGRADCADAVCGSVGVGSGSLRTAAEA